MNLLVPGLEAMQPDELGLPVNLISRLVLSSTAFAQQYVQVRPPVQAGVGGCGRGSCVEPYLAPGTCCSAQPPHTCVILICHTAGRSRHLPHTFAGRGPGPCRAAAPASGQQPRARADRHAAGHESAGTCVQGGVQHIRGHLQVWEKCGMCRE